MKTTNLFELLLLLFAMFSFVSCDKDDEVNISQLKGTWSVANDDPRLIVEGSVDYTFNSDNTCAIYCYDVLSNRDTTFYRTYVLSIDNSLITLKKEDGFYSEQYHIRKLTSKEMKWKNASPNDGNTDKRLVKITDKSY